MKGLTEFFPGTNCVEFFFFFSSFSKFLWTNFVLRKHLNGSGASSVAISWVCFVEQCQCPMPSPRDDSSQMNETALFHLNEEVARSTRSVCPPTPSPCCSALETTSVWICEFFVGAWLKSALCVVQRLPCCVWSRLQM